MIPSAPHAPLATNVITLFLVEVVPLRILQQSGETTSSSPDAKHTDEPPSTSLTAALVKLHLQQRTCPLSRNSRDMQMRWDDTSDDEKLSKASAASSLSRRRGSFVLLRHDIPSRPYWASVEMHQRVVPLVYIPSERPTDIEPCPCWIVGYGFLPHHAPTDARAAVSDATLVRVLPMENAIARGDGFETVDSAKLHTTYLPWKDRFLGETSDVPLNEALQDEILSNHDDETTRALTLRMKMLLANPMYIGTSINALYEHKRRRQRKHRIRLAATEYCRNLNGVGVFGSNGHTSEPGVPKTTGTNESTHSYVSSLVSGGALIVHSPHHGAGKTLLVRTIAQRHLKCDATHVIRPGALLAKYGIHADAALESLLHGICTSAASQGNSVCILLDHLDAMVTPQCSGRHGAGDAAVPVLNGIASYLKNLTSSLQRKHEFPFPTNNSLYNWDASNGAVLPFRLCLIGIVTCSDNGGIRQGSSESVLDALGGERFRLPDLSAHRRVAAFESAFRRENLVLSKEAMTKLPALAASKLSARGGAFSRVARKLAECSSCIDSVKTHEIDNAMAALHDEWSQSSNVAFYPRADPRQNDKDHRFAAVGGNSEAKAALEEALALDPSKHALLARFGMSPPTGVLLYGPPGTGKTLLARAVANILNSKVGNAGSSGGAFISLRAGDLIRSEVGGSEKLLVSSFETARSNAPSTVFIDEFEALFAERGSGGGGKLASSLLQCMDDVYKWKDADAIANSEASRVVVMGATNAPWTIDKAFLRPGRFDRVVFVGLPTLAERKAILEVHVSRMRLRLGESRLKQVVRICETLAADCDGWSGADLAALCRAAAVRCLVENGENGGVSLEQFLDARKFDVSGSSDEALMRKLVDWRP